MKKHVSLPHAPYYRFVETHGAAEGALHLRYHVRTHAGTIEEHLQPLPHGHDGQQLLEPRQQFVLQDGGHVIFTHQDGVDALRLEGNWRCLTGTYQH